MFCPVLSSEEAPALYWRQGKRGPPTVSVFLSMVYIKFLHNRSLAYRSLLNGVCKMKRKNKYSRIFQMTFPKGRWLALVSYIGSKVEYVIIVNRKSLNRTFHNYKSHRNIKHQTWSLKRVTSRDVSKSIDKTQCEEVNSKHLYSGR